tara:strand:+ start:1165 stop:1512 length:348 start_codon:yes stop_codon:yes gene_type:complete
MANKPKKGLTAAQKKLPKKLQEAILKKQGTKGMKNGGKVTTKGMRNGGRVKAKGMKNGGKVRKMSKGGATGGVRKMSKGGAMGGKVKRMSKGGAMGGKSRGGRAALRGTKFTGVK